MFFLPNGLITFDFIWFGFTWKIKLGQFNQPIRKLRKKKIYPWHLLVPFSLLSTRAGKGPGRQRSGCSQIAYHCILKLVFLLKLNKSSIFSLKNNNQSYFLEFNFVCFYISIISFKYSSCGDLWLVHIIYIISFKCKIISHLKPMFGGHKEWLKTFATSTCPV